MYCQCDECNEPDPHCEHRVNLAVAVCPQCTPIQNSTYYRLLEHSVTMIRKMFVACEYHRFDLARGIGIKDYFPINGVPIHDITLEFLECDYCIKLHKRLV